MLRRLIFSSVLISQVGAVRQTGEVRWQLQGPIPVEFAAVFPRGVFAAGGFEPVRDFEASKAGGRFVQSKDKQSGLPLWVVDVIDGDPAAREKTARVKVAAADQPTLPAAPARAAVRAGGVRRADGDAVCEPGRAAGLLAAGDRRPGRARRPWRRGEPGECGMSEGYCLHHDQRASGRAGQVAVSFYLDQRARIDTCAGRAKRAAPDRPARRRVGQHRPGPPGPGHHRRRAARAQAGRRGRHIRRGDRAACRTRRPRWRCGIENGKAGRQERQFLPPPVSPQVRVQPREVLMLVRTPTGEQLAQVDNPDPFTPPVWRSPVHRTPEPRHLARPARPPGRRG